MVLVDHTTGNVRPATTVETELWNALTKRVAPTRESYIRVNEQDLMSLLMERDQLRQQLEHQMGRFEAMTAETESLRQQLHGQETNTRQDLPAQSERDAAGGEPSADGGSSPTTGE